MDQRTLDVLEFHKIKEILSIYASSSLGKSFALLIQPGTDIHQIEVWQRQVTELKRLMGNRELPLGGIRDIRSHLESIKDPVSVMGCEALLDVHSTLQSARNIKGYLSDLSNDYPNLSNLGKKIGIFKDIEDIIYASIDLQGVIKDNATQKLHSIRREIDVKRARIKSKLHSLMRSSHLSQYLQDSTVTIRNDRSVILIKARFRDKVPGIVRDQSDSGESVFIEPEAITSSGDELHQLIQEEKQEMFRILQEITSKIRNKLDDILQTLKMLSIVDLIFAKVCFSRDFDMTEPILNQDSIIDIKKARHPLLMFEKGWGRHLGQPKKEPDPDSVVPIDVRIGEDFDTLVITGPNTGGKTVSLKTIGILTLMTQAGLHIPASPGSRVAIFRDIFADIGDEQSIQQNLSTFSAHLTQIVRILNNANRQILVLLDELGTGTDPQEGAALGIAIIDFLHEKDARTMATTHLTALKTYAHAHPRIENASVEFDMETLQPTYRLFIGTFGSSNALAIASRLGLPKQVVTKATELVQREDARIEDLINALQQVKAKLENERVEASIAKEEALKIKNQYETMIKSLKEREEKLASSVT
ncbi:MAG: mismatch repair protein MutS2, partial [Candidatus Poribacteria bacterium]|nr:mismatch repair protein MutS2 [Candidatus Poribacteria bacterium]